MIHLESYLIVSAIMFFAGIYGFFTRRSTLTILISIELILNATDINFAVFNFADCCVVVGAILLFLYMVFGCKDSDFSTVRGLVLGSKPAIKELANDDRDQNVDDSERAAE